jgi:hypothetical protein
VMYFAIGATFLTLGGVRGHRSEHCVDNVRHLIYTLRGFVAT